MGKVVETVWVGPGADQKLRAESVRGMLNQRSFSDSRVRRAALDVGWVVDVRVLVDHVVFQCDGEYLAERCPSTLIFATVVDNDLSNLLDSSVIGVVVAEPEPSCKIDHVCV